MTSTAELPEVLVVIVAWNSAAHLAAAAGSVPKGTPVVVVDNASGDDSAAVAEKVGARVIRLGSNIGFGPACNLGVKEGIAAETILFLNPDAALIDGVSALAVLLAELRSDPRIGAVAPALVGPGQELFQLRRLPTLGSLLREALLVNRLFPSNRFLRRERYIERERALSFDVEQPAAAALMIRRELFQKLGGFDPAFFPAWFEDVDLCARLWKSGNSIRFVPAAQASHRGGVSMKALPYGDYLPLYTRNLFRYLARHASRSVRVLARGIVGTGALLRLGLLVIVKGDHARGESARAFLRVLRGVLGFGWRTALDRTVRS